MAARRPRRPAGPPGRLGRASQPRFGAYIRARREGRLKTDRRFSLRQVARRICVQPAYLSQVERGNVAPPSEATT